MTYDHGGRAADGRLVKIGALVRYDHMKWRVFSIRHYPDGSIALGLIEPTSFHEAATPTEDELRWAPNGMVGLL